MKADRTQTDPLAGVDAAILQLEQMEAWADALRATAPRAVAEFGDLSRRMKPTAIGFMIELSVEEWKAIAIENHCRYNQ